MKLDFCVACGERDLDRLEHHHLVPRSASGGDEDLNLITLCHVCHGRAHGIVRRDVRALTRVGLQTAKARGVKLGGVRPGVEMTAETRAKGTASKVAKADARATDLAPTIAEMRAAGATSLGQLAAALTNRGIPTAKGGTTWNATQVARVLRQAGA